MVKGHKLLLLARITFECNYLTGAIYLTMLAMSCRSDRLCDERTAVINKCLYWELSSCLTF